MCSTANYDDHTSTECGAGGNAQCDGYCYDHDAECACWCHTTSDLPGTVDEILAAHDEDHKVVSSINDTNPQAQFLLQREAAVLNDKPVDGTLYVVRAGQDRVFIQQVNR